MPSNVAATGAKRRFCLVLVKPTRYCDDDYPIRWFRSTIPSNSLACVYGIAKDCNERRVLGDDVEIDIHAIDEFNTRIWPDRIAALIKGADDGMVFLVGVQSNQTPRALDIARPLRQAGIKVGIGGFHMSGVISMINGDDPALREAQAIGLSVFAGEAEGRLDEVLRDAYADRLNSLYNYMDDAPGINAAPLPLLEQDLVKRTVGSTTSFDAGRGCPYQCSFCTIINVQGHKSRRRTVDDIEDVVRRNAAQGAYRFFITDDNFARNKDWEAILDRLIHLREVEKNPLSLIIQVDTLCHKLPNFIAKCWRAGVKKTYIGLENINPANLMAAKKKLNKITEYRKMLLEWQKAGILVYAGYITGFPFDTAESVLKDLDVIMKELPIDVLEVHYLTPLPGSEDHQKLYRAGTWMEPGPQQIRPPSHHLRTSAHVEAGMGLRLPRVVEAILLLRTLRNGHAARRRASLICERLDHDDVVQGVVRTGKLPSGRERPVAAEVPPRSPADHAARTGLAFLPEINRRTRAQDGWLDLDLSQAAQDLSAHQARSQTVRIQRFRNHARGRR